VTWEPTTAFTDLTPGVAPANGFELPPDYQRGTSTT
jgi:hypothetical protein